MAAALPKMVAIVGPTSSGKTRLSLIIAKRFQGEVVSADSRQVYTKMNVGTAKPYGIWQKLPGRDAYVVEGVPHYLVDTTDPGHEMSLAEYKNEAFFNIDAILTRKLLPVVVGGTGLYIWSIIDNLEPPKVAPNKVLRRSLEERSLADLLLWLKRLDPESYATVDIKNPRRVIRALEVAIMSGESFTKQKKQAEPLYNVLQIGLHRDLSDLYTRIDAAVDHQISDGLIEETQALIKQKYGWNLPSMSSIGYKQIGDYLQGKCTKEEAVADIKQATHKYAKRQLTWFKRDKRIVWINGDDVTKATDLVQKFLEQ